MLVARQCEPLRHSWSSVKLGSPFQEEKAPRMSNLEPISSQSEWRDSYTQDWQATENLPALTSLYEQPITTHSVGASSLVPLYEPRPSLHHRHSLAQVESRQQPFSESHIDRSNAAPHVKVEQQFTTREQDQPYLDSRAATFQESPRFDVKAPETAVDEAQAGHQQQREDEDEHEEDDDEMLDPEERLPGDGRPPQTEAERRAERRKMKRFRLTHQQTRFLMSEFAKQAHPDAAHRERLSREIPGLSPRQVQVWFQNRRAKIKRLHADDRDRMMKMRAVPEGFDNVQALHSPYGSYPGGAVHILGPSMHSSMDYPQNHGDYDLGLRPLMVDPARRPEHDDHLSPGSLVSPYGSVGYAQPSPVGATDMLSSLSSQGGRYFSGSYSSQLQSGQHRDTSVYSRHNSMDSYGMQNRQGTRPIQPLQPLPRSRSDSLQSPLGRTSMSWKGDTIDYGNYQQPQTMSPSTSIRQTPLYQGDLSTTASNQQPQYSNDTYAATNIHTSPQSTYSFNQTSQPENPSIPRFRSSSAAFPSTLNLQNTYRPHQSPNLNQPISHTGVTSTPRSSYTSAYSTGGFQSAPLLPAAEFQMPRTPDIRSGDNAYQMSHLSRPMTAPMAAPQDFNAAYQAMSLPRPGSTLAKAQESRASGSVHSGHNETAALSIPHESEGQETQQHQQQQHGQHQSEHYMRHDGYGQPVGAPPSRKRTFSMSENYEGS